MLRLIADEAGPARVRGRLLRLGWIGGQPVGARRRPRDREEEAGRGLRGRRPRVVVGTDAHSSIINTLRLLEMDALVVDTPEHRLTAGRRCGPRSPPSRPVRHRRGGVHVGHDERRNHRRPRRGRRARQGARLVVPRRRRVRRFRHLRALAAAEVRRDRAGRLVHPGPAQVVVHAVRLLCPALSRSGAGARHAHPGRVLPRCHPRHRRRVEPVGLRLPPDPARPRAAAVVLARGVRRRGLPGGDRGRRVPRASRRRS